MKCIKKLIITTYLLKQTILCFAKNESCVIDEIFIKFHKNHDIESIPHIVSKYKLKEKQRFKLTDAILYKFDHQIAPTALRIILNNEDSVEYSDINHNSYQTKSYNFNDDRLNEQWSLNNTGQTINGKTGNIGSDINWLNAIKIYNPKSDVVVAVIDSGISLDHPELSFRLAGMVSENNGISGYDDDGIGLIDDYVGWDFIDGDNDPSDLNGHGTNVAGIIASAHDNSIGISGVSHNTYILPLRVFDEYGQGATDEKIILAASYAIDAGARVINLSLGKEQPFSIPLQESIYALESEYDTLLVCAAGNGGDDRIGDNLDTYPVYPAAYDGKAILSVAASNEHGELAPFSNFGSKRVDIAAPGTNILAPDVSRSVIYSEDFEVYSIYWRYFSASGNLSPYQWNYFEDIYGNYWVTDSDYDIYFNKLDYTSYTNTYLMSPLYDLRGIISPHIEVTVYHELAYDYWYNSYDLLLFEITRDGVNWDLIDYAYGYSHIQGTVYKFDISQYEDSLVNIRFRLFSDGTFQDDGVYIDNLIITGVTPFSYSGEEYRFVSGTSFATPLVSGVAAMILSQRPDLSALDARDIIMQSVTSSKNLEGKVLSGGILNAEAALNLANEWNKTGWVLSDTLGYYYQYSSNWAWHPYMGWTYFQEGSHWFWNVSLGWVWTGSDVFPYIYSASKANWLYYQSHEGVGYYWDYSTVSWITKIVI